MNIIVGKTSGFCYGVKNAVEQAKEKLSNSNQEIYCLGELVHNEIVMKELIDAGLQVVDDIHNCKGEAIIRAHGIKKQTYEDAQKENVKLIDLTCPSVLKIHKIIEKYAKDNAYIFLIGHKNHPETIGNFSFGGEKISVIEKIEDVELAYKNFENTNKKSLLVISQTTFSLEKFSEIVQKIRETISKEVILQVENTICPTTELRQKETEEISKKVDFMIIVGGKNSSNTQKLYDIACQNCKNVIWINKKAEIPKECIAKFSNFGIMAGASTPLESVEEIVKFLKEETICVEKSLQETGK